MFGFRGDNAAIGPIAYRLGTWVVLLIVVLSRQAMRYVKVLSTQPQLGHKTRDSRRNTG